MISGHPHEWFIKAFRTSPIGMAFIDVKGEILFANPSFNQMFGYESPSPFKNIYDMIDIEQKEKLVGWIKENDTPKYTCEYPVIHREGHTVWVEATFLPIYSSSEEIQCFIVHFGDITSNKTVVQELERSEKLSLAGRLAAGIAHEVRNPLTSIKGFIQLLKKSGTDPNGYLNVVLDEIDRMEFILSELLIIGKPREKRLEWNDFGALLENVITLIQSQGALNNVEIRTTYHISPLPNMFCDGVQIKQVFINFLKNAIEAMPNGGIIQVDVATHESQLVVTIVDQGVGIPKEQYQRLGQPFFTTKKNGTGLGLSICYQIIHNHNGNINITSDSSGTTVMVSLPIC